MLTTLCYILLSIPFLARTQLLLPIPIRNEREPLNRGLLQRQANRYHPTLCRIENLSFILLRIPFLQHKTGFLRFILFTTHERRQGGICNDRREGGEREPFYIHHYYVVIFYSSTTGE